MRVVIRGRNQAEPAVFEVDEGEGPANVPNHRFHKRSARILTPSQLSRAGRTSRKNDKLFEDGSSLFPV
jgi:hypothetical protein